MEEDGRSSLYREGDRFPLDSFYRECSYVHTCCCSLSQSSCRTKHQMFRLHNLKSARSSIRLAVLSINLSFSRSNSHYQHVVLHIYFITACIKHITIIFLLLVFSECRLPMTFMGLLILYRTSS